MDDYLRGWLQEEGLDKAREHLEWTRQHYGPKEEAQVLAEIEFYEWLLALYDTGEPVWELRARPDYGVLRVVLEGLDGTVERDQETLPLWRRQGKTDKVSAAETRIAKALKVRPYVAAIEPAEGSIEWAKQWFDRTADPKVE